MEAAERIDGDTGFVGGTVGMDWFQCKPQS